ncbi:MAG: putative hemolysin [Candidatus Omnitrophota bacterium]|jgi:putative hemolysin
MESKLFLLILLFILFILSAIFSGAEAAYISINKIRLRHMREQKKKGAEHIWRLVLRMEEVITTILVCNNLVNTAIAAIVAILFVDMFGPHWGILLSTVAVTLTLLIFCETTPKIYATHNSESVSFGFRHIISFLIVLFNPLVRICNRISAFLIRLCGVKPSKRAPLVTEEEIKLMIRIGKDEGYYGDDERKMLERIFQFDEIDVYDVMTSFDGMVSVDAGIDDDDLANILMEKGHNRIPVYKENKQNIIGILYVHDLLYLIKNNDLIKIQDLLSAPYYVPPDKKVSVLLKEFQTKKIQIALVRAKTGKILGLVTLTDLLEEIVGEIEEVTPI